MARALIYLDENLASSIALRYLDYLSSVVELEPFILHVVEPDGKEQAGVGWVRRTWEAGMIESGKATISRLLKTEKVKCSFAGPPKIKIGDRDREVVRELKTTMYDLYIEGYLPTSKSEEFYDLIKSDRYTKSPCSIMCVKNLSLSKTVGVLVGDGVDPEMVASTLKNLLSGSSMDIELIHYSYQESDNLAFLEKEQAGSLLVDAEKIFQDYSLPLLRTHVVAGTPESVGDFLINYAFVACSFLARKSLITEILGLTPVSILLCK
ncbi:hypothetical protein DBT_0613 [Dissulfuribacter thermophilus]|uniref:UspA domain-containing protein n=1 Tax=Dissulfuribacter thermophilus TaxID=1156395 RepID=A0A1B9F8P9_9BACT|nr:hypothetical protein [Dissulfuribacter thermophilus]OCC16151.1 hypothetical protein DBT_0613 [Dissulfuribacter thermophilus]